MLSDMFWVSMQLSCRAAGTSGNKNFNFVGQAAINQQTKVSIRVTPVSVARQ